MKIHLGFLKMAVPLIASKLVILYFEQDPNDLRITSPVFQVFRFLFVFMISNFNMFHKKNVNMCFMGHTRKGKWEQKQLLNFNPIFAIVVTHFLGSQ